MKQLITEVPKQATTHSHRWQIVEGGSGDPKKVMMVCAEEGCTATKLVDRPVVKESVHEKPVLLG